ncbi:efflux RND transporter periplasmic adaptor subunit [Steroidobacter sp. S1-65]|uniref:Efflux RND transporter periplasmic adaptor subunit n=1 Tax=Steroidobacter gossypii TaxID=2805490 RepID=A0ABS1X3H0_9GAMM|nr:efflux RND transporter periplasmic adaptor subunit [Steroidobacter gossypii]MBM0107777.1 efflux RND transporter periplasmic adaptor subunit [Steroidobacter gossypii]
MQSRQWIGSFLLVGAVIVSGVLLSAWKRSSIAESEAAAASQPEPAESIVTALVREHEHVRTTTSIGTVVATRSITVRNELPGTVRHVALEPGKIVEAGTVLVAMDVSVEEADLQALLAQAELARTQFARMQRMSEHRAASEMEVDSARAEQEVVQAQVARIKAVINRKIIRAPFRARIGISDVHPGQYLNEGTLLTTLQGVDDEAYVDFTVSQQVAADLRPGNKVDVFTGSGTTAGTEAEIVAIDARVDPSTRNAMVRAKIKGDAPAPGASVRVQVDVGTPTMAAVVPASAVRKGPSGDHVFVVLADEHGKMRARLREVQVDAMAGDQIVITKGLEPGELVAASGSFKLREAALVAVTNPAESVAQNESHSAATSM